MQKQTLAGVGMMFLLLAEGPHSVSELVELTHLHESTVRRWMRSLTRSFRTKGMRRPVRVAHWEKIGRSVVAFYELNLQGKPDTPRPPKCVDMAEKSRQYRARKRLGPHLAQLLYTASPATR